MRWPLLAALALAPATAHAEGSRDLDRDEGVWNGSSGGIAHDQAVSAATALRIDLLQPAEEKVCWRGTGSLSLAQPDGTHVATLPSAGCSRAVAGVAGAYQAQLGQDQQVGSAWDIRVCAGSVADGACLDDDANQRPGRVWSSAWGFSANSSFLERYSINGSVYAIVPGGEPGRDAVIELQMRGVSGGRYALRANASGTSTAAGAAVGHSVPRDAAHTVAAEYPLYLHPPARARYNWLTPALSEVRLTTACGTAVVQDLAPAHVQFHSNVAGQYVLVCDVNQDGAYDLAGDADFSVVGASAIGGHSVDWDGRNNRGERASEGSYRCLIRLSVGVFHYVAEDIESAYPGIRMYRVEPDQLTRSPLRMFWDDRAVVATDRMLNAQRSPDLPPAAGLDPGPRDAAATAFYFADGDRARPLGNARAWGDFDPQGIGKGNEAYLDQFTAAATAISSPLLVHVLGASADSDADGLNNARECALGSDPEQRDGDGDGVLDGSDIARENPRACLDLDGDACDDCSQRGADGSGGDPAHDGPDDDGDGRCNLGDTDDDNDGVADVADPAPGVVRSCGDSDADRCDDCSAGAGARPAADGLDSDADGACDLGDADDDGDGVPDGDDSAPLDPRRCRDQDADGCDDCALRAHDDPRMDGPDQDGDGLCNLGDGRPGDDADRDGRGDLDDLDDDGDGMLDTQEQRADTRADADADGLSQALDLDSDADGIYDADESGHDAADKDADGRVDGALGQNGIADGVESTPDSGRVRAPRDSDRDGLPDFLDTDSDADGADDRAEAGDDRLATLPRDTDADGDPDFRDADDDGDGIASKDERSGPERDHDRDGIPDVLDSDDDGDGNPTRSERPGEVDRDSDGDGAPDHLDPDDDGDGVDSRDERTHELEDVDTDGDTVPDHLDPDDDGDGIATKDELDDGDGDGVPDRLRPVQSALSGGALCSAQPGAPGAAPLGWLLLLLLAALGLRRRAPRRQAPLTLAGGLLIAAATTPAHAQIALEQLKPAPVASDGFGVARPEALPRGRWSTQLWIDYANDPLVSELGTGDERREQKVVEHHLIGHVGFAVGLARRFTLFASLPVHILMDGEQELSTDVPAPDGDGLGDLVLGGRIQLSGLAASARFASALELIARAPTAELFNRQQHYSGDSIGSYEPALSGEVRAGRFDVRLRAGARLRKQANIGDLELGHELIAGLGMRLRLVDGLHLHAEGYGSTFLSEPFKGRTSPVEALFGIKYQGDALVVGAAAGPGLTRGFGSPDVRVVTTLGYAPRPKQKPKPKDSDGDGRLDPDDRCPRQPEDQDGFEDQDGCPDPDNDGDGVNDSQDACIDEPEDTDDFDDADGCPDPDNDKDGVQDPDDACPLEPEDTDGTEDQDGCPDPDNDKDGLTDLDDHCPDEPEDVDGYEDQDGCPEAGGGLVKITCARIEIGEMVYFDTGKDTIQARSFALLDQVANVLIEAKHILRLRVAGHSDDRGNDKRNLELSKRRAASVLRYLVVHGVENGRLSSEGYGETEPIASNKTAEGRAKNRRVEFQILEQSTECKGP